MQPSGYEWLCRQIVERSQDAIIFGDRAGLIQLWNTGAETVFGYTSEEALGQSLDLIIPEPLRQRHWEGYRQAMATGESRYAQDLLAVPAMRRDGTRISIEFSIVMVRSTTQEVLGSAAIIRDVTTRWQRDKAIKERLAALEAKTGGPPP